MKQLYLRVIGLLLFFMFSSSFLSAQSWIRINQLGYPRAGSKVAVWVSKNELPAANFELVNAATQSIVYTAPTGKSFGAYGPFSQSKRLNFSSFSKPGRYFLRCGTSVSPSFDIADDVYKHLADFPLQYLRQQRSGFNPFLNDSCHTGDGYTMYGPMPDSSHIDVSGGWHDATDYLQYTTTSANATYHLLAAYRDFPAVFGDQHKANGLPGSNGLADVLDEARWGIKWLLKMHPRNDWLFTQLADDRDHTGFRLPNQDSVDYGMGKGKSRPVYFATGKPQGLGKYQNQSTGVASAAGKFASAFSLGAMLFAKSDTALANLLSQKSLSAYQLGIDKPGVCQTAPNKAPYYYAEDNWTDDMELAAASLFHLTGDPKFLNQSMAYSRQEPVTPWMGADTARHYQWYPFHNFGHYEIAGSTSASNRALLIGYYRKGIERVWKKSAGNAFYRGIPFIWCSNNLTVSFAIQCYLYRKLSGDKKYIELEEACFDWLFGCNPWGKSMLYGFPLNGNTVRHPHSSFSILKQYSLNGALVDGPVYGSIFNSLRGLTLYNDDEYAEFQSDMAVYHDDAGDYSTNEPTMDGTASLVYLLAQKESLSRQNSVLTSHGAIIRGKTNSKKIALVFTGDEYADGAKEIASTLKHAKMHASFFLTGNFYKNKKLAGFVKQLKQQGNYLGVHSDQHLLYCDWNNRDSLLVTHEAFVADLRAAYQAMGSKEIDTAGARYFLPPYEWYNDSIAAWTRQLGLQLVCFSPGTRSNADYTWPQMDKKYVSSKVILRSILDYDRNNDKGLNGFILLLHIGTDPRRTDKFYSCLPQLIRTLKSRGYQFAKIDELLN